MNDSRRFLVLAALTLGVLIWPACESAPPSEVEPAPAEARAPVPADGFERAMLVKLDTVPPQETPGLHNVYHLGERIISGSEPHGEEAFVQLAEWGVKTVLSVDGKAPEAELAARYGIRYVHVPIEYSGITEDEMLKLTKTFRETEGPFYVHCFHGKHRGPAAAAVGRIVLDGVAREVALAEMRQWCGTSQKYGGLYDVVATAEMPSAATTAGFDWDFPSRHEFEGFRAIMIESTRHHDNLKHLGSRGWAADPAHPDVDPMNEAEKLLGLFEAATSLEELKGEPEDFEGWMQETIQAGRSLVEATRRLRAGAGAEAATAATGALERISTTCNACHVEYRN